MVEQLICNQQVAGSSPITSSKQGHNPCPSYMGEFPSGQRGQTVNLLLLASMVRIHPLPPRRGKVRFAPFFFTEKHPPASLLLLFRKRSRSRRLFAYKCAHNAFGLLTTFCDYAPMAQVYLLSDIFEHRPVAVAYPKADPRLRRGYIRPLKVVLI